MSIFAQAKHLLILVISIIFTNTLTRVQALNFNFSSFQEQNRSQLILSPNSNIAFDAIQVTPDSAGIAITNMVGRVFYGKPFRIQNKSKKASFNTTFVLTINNQTFPGGEGLAFILSGDTSIPENSNGQWLGIVNSTTNGTSNIVAVEFDTRKSYPDDIDDNHVGLDVNSIYSMKQVSLTRYGLNLSYGMDFITSVRYDGENISIFIAVGNETESLNTDDPIISLPIDLSSFLPEQVYIGFSASTSNQTELNCISSWQFEGLDIDDEDNKKRLWFLITIPILAVILSTGIIFIFYYVCVLRNYDQEEGCPDIEGQIQDSSIAPKKFTLSELKNATGNFDPKNKLGKGGFGTVYKGIIMMNKLEVAVKKVSKNSRQGKQEFIAEVTTIGSLHHKNLVKLIGWCYERRDLLLVYEYMPNGSLNRRIFGEGPGSLSLSWERRRSIIHGVAEAVDYLHNGCEKRVIHRDIKASNIMLDSEFNPKLGDFGLARTIQKREQTHHSTRVLAGTPGYMAPESFLRGRATVETDVYAFGILLLEVICGRKAGNPSEGDDYSCSIANWVWEFYRRGSIVDCVDSRLKRREIVAVEGEEGDGGIEMECLLILGLACCDPNPNKRPCMKSVLQVLEGEVGPPLVPAERPAFVWPPAPPSFKEALESSVGGSQLATLTEITGR